MDKNEEKQLVNSIKKHAKEQGLRCVSQFIWCIEEDIFMRATFGVVRSHNRLTTQMGAKKMIYDELFWDIMDMQGNNNAPVSLRANGAFVSPVYIYHKEWIDIGKDLDLIAHDFVELFFKESSDFLNSFEDMNQFVINNPDERMINNDILRTLAYLDLGQYAMAKQIALEDDGRGGFVNAGRGFFERVLSKY